MKNMKQLLFESRDNYFYIRHYRVHVFYFKEYITMYRSKQRNMNMLYVFISIKLRVFQSVTALIIVMCGGGEGGLGPGHGHGSKGDDSRGVMGTGIGQMKRITSFISGKKKNVTSV